MTQPAFSFVHRTPCQRCGVSCRINSIPGSKAKMLKRGSTPKGLCVNCAVHDTLRNLYPANLILARSGPKGLVLPHIQQQFFAIVQMAGTDATFEEIDWQAIIDHWDLPFRTPLKRTATNPVTETELATARLEGDRRRAGTCEEPLTEEEHQTQKQTAIIKLLDVLQGDRHGKDTPPDHSDGD